MYLAGHKDDDYGSHDDDKLYVWYIYIYIYVYDFISWAHDDDDELDM